MTDEIEIIDYDPQWPKQFDAEARHLRNVLPSELLLGIEHMGSTAVPGLPAKPIIDIALAVRSLEEAQAKIVGLLETIGYAFWRDNPQKDRLFFVKGLPPTAPQRTHHVHITELEGEVWTRRLFRDYLRMHPDRAVCVLEIRPRPALPFRSRGFFIPAFVFVVTLAIAIGPTATSQGTVFRPGRAHAGRSARISPTRQSR